MVACLLSSCVQTVLCHAFVPLIRQESQIYDLTQLGILLSASIFASYYYRLIFFLGLFSVVLVFSVIVLH